MLISQSRLVINVIVSCKHIEYHNSRNEAEQANAKWEWPVVHIMQIIIFVIY